MATKYLSINRVVDKTEWSDGLKKSMILDFVASGYGNVASLIGGNETETSKAIQAKVSGFSSGKNTYLQANQIAKIIHSLSSGEAPKRFYRRSTKTASTNDGEMIKDCSGWSITKKNLEDGRVVYNANIKSDTPKNKGDWAAIKGDVYVETNFKWNFKFQKFERWGQIENQDEVIEKLCQVLAKYYEGGEKPVPETPAPEAPKQQKSIKDIAEEVMTLEFEIWEKLDIKSGGQLLASQDLQEKYADEVKKVIIPKLDSYSLRDSQKLDLRATLTDSNAHKLNNSLSLIGYYGKDDKEESILDYEKNPLWSLNPKYYTEKSEGEERLFMVGDTFYARNYENETYFISSISSDDQVGFASIKTPKAEAIFGTVGEVNRLFKEGIWVKIGRYDYPEETPKAKSKADIEKAIKGLQFLADKGNDKAKKAIIGLKILLNK
jgi:hypothetical protein